jgi:hypothetical protein
MTNYISKINTYIVYIDVNSYIDAEILLLFPILEKIRSHEVLN